MTLFFVLPEWLFFIITVLFVKFSHEVGFKIGTMRRLRPGDNPETAAGTISGIMIGMLAFMLAFTFNGASNDHDLRKDLMIEEANAIRTSYQRSMAMPDPYRTKVRDLLGEYLDIRLKMRRVRVTEIKPLIDRTIAIQTELWSVVVELQKKEPATPMLGLFTESLNQVFNVNVKRFNAVFQGRISTIIWVVLYLLTFITMAMMGYRIGLHGIRSNFMELTLILAFSSVLVLIMSLDSPYGVMRINPRPLVNVLAMIRAGN